MLRAVDMAAYAQAGGFGAPHGFFGAIEADGNRTLDDLRDLATTLRGEGISLCLDLVLNHVAREHEWAVAARAGDETVKSQLAPRFQEAIDEAAMRLGDTGADDYLAGWERSPWTGADGTPAEVLGRVVAELDAQWPADRIADYLDGLDR